MSNDLTPVFERLERWLAAHAPQIHAELAPGVEESELDGLEALTGQPLPADFRALYRRHGDWVLALRLTHLPLTGVHHEWEVWRDLEPEYGSESEGHRSHPEGAITPRSINLGWIPFLIDHGGNSVGIDLAPGPKGVRGQVITFGRDEREKFVLAPSLGDFLREYVGRLEAGQATVLTDEDDPDEERIEMTDESGESVNEYLWLADLYPGFGASLRDG